MSSDVTFSVPNLILSPNKKVGLPKLKFASSLGQVVPSSTKFTIKDTTIATANDKSITALKVGATTLSATVVVNGKTYTPTLGISVQVPSLSPGPGVSKGKKKKLSTGAIVGIVVGAVVVVAAIAVILGMAMHKKAGVKPPTIATGGRHSHHCSH